AIQANLSEKARREIRQFAERYALRGRDGEIAALVQQTVLNFINKLLLQPHFDRTEYLRGQALAMGQIDWTFGGINLKVDYPIPSDHMFATRTGNDGYGGTSSKWWADHRKAQRLLKGTYDLSIAHPDTIDEIVYNDANSANILSIANGRYTIQRFRGSLERPSTDARETMTLVAYSKE